MAGKMKTIKIERNAFGRFNYESDTYTELDISECQLISLLGAVFGVTITHPSFVNDDWMIEVTKIPKSK